MSIFICTRITQLLLAMIFGGFVVLEMRNLSSSEFSYYFKQGVNLFVRKSDLNISNTTLTASVQNKFGGTPPRNISVLCWLMTDPKILSKAIPARDTWTKRCDIRLFMSSSTNRSFPTIGLNVQSGRDHISEKSKAAWTYIYQNYLDKADFFIKADPDSYVAVDNLKEYLRNCNTSEPNVYGHTLEYPGKFYKGFYAAGEAIVLTRAAVKLLVAKGFNKCFSKGQAEDLKTSRCLVKAGGHVIDTRDEFGRETFLPPLPVSMIIKNRFPQWYTDVYRRSLGYCKSVHCLSDYPIAFHYVDQERMYLIDYLINHGKYKTFNKDTSIKLRFNGTIYTN